MAVVYGEARYAPKSRRKSDIAKAKAGARSEQLIIDALSKSSKVEAIICSLSLGRPYGDIDVLCFAPGPVVVEVKTGRGPLSIQRGRLVAGGKKIPRDPLGQCARQINVFAEFGLLAAGIVVVADSPAPMTKVDGALFLAGGRNVVEHVSKLGAISKGTPLDVVLGAFARQQAILGEYNRELGEAREKYALYRSRLKRMSPAERRVGSGASMGKAVKSFPRREKRLLTDLKSVREDLARLKELERQMT